jgi:predicted TIM-barrel fold metal-dependent hydrolase
VRAAQIAIARPGPGGTFWGVLLIDSHIHLYPPEANRDPAAWAEAQGETHWATLSTRRRANGRLVQGFLEVDALLRALDDAHIGRAVLLGWYWQRPETCARQNRFYTACVRAHPDRLSACATLHPSAGRDATLEEVRRAAGEGLIGLGELSPHSQGYAVDDPVFAAVLSLAGERRLPVNLHVTDPDTPPYPGRVLTPLADFEALARAHPATTFILAHWGGLLPIRDPAVRELTNLYYDTAASPLLYGPGVWGRFIGEVGPERVLFGSDFPLNLYPKHELESALVRFVEEARNSGLDLAALEPVLAGNAKRVFRLPGGAGK